MHLKFHMNILAHIKITRTGKLLVLQKKKKRQVGPQKYLKGQCYHCSFKCLFNRFDFQNNFSSIFQSIFTLHLKKKNQFSESKSVFTYPPLLSRAAHLIGLLYFIVPLLHVQAIPLLLYYQVHTAPFQKSCFLDFTLGPLFSLSSACALSIFHCHSTAKLLSTS